MDIKSRVGSLYKKSPLLFIVALILLFVVLPVLAFLAAQNTSSPVDFYGTKVNTLKIFGAKGFGDVSRDFVDGKGIYHAAGVTVDKRKLRGQGLDIIYTVDTANNRILAHRGMAYCKSGDRVDTSRSCNTDSDCNGVGVCYYSTNIDEVKPADKVFGQPDMNSSGCNGNSLFGFYKNLGAQPSASTLCLMHFPLVGNVAESWGKITIDTDTDGTLYVLDVFNNRMLKYYDPFSSDTINGKGDTIADEVIGQPDFSSNGIDRSGTPSYAPLSYDSNNITPSADGLHLVLGQPYAATARGVSVDPQGNVWISDQRNHRILRFPKQQDGTTSKVADIAIGQPNLTSKNWAAHCFDSFAQNNPTVIPQEANSLCLPTLARVSPYDGKLYVLDESRGPWGTRFLVFDPPFATGMKASRVVLPTSGPAYWNNQYLFQSPGFVFNSYTGTGTDGAVYTAGDLLVAELESSRAVLIDRVTGNVKQAFIYDPLDWRNHRGGDIYGGVCSNILSTQHEKDLYNPFGGYNSYNASSISNDSDGNIYLGDESGHKIGVYRLPYNTKVVGNKTCTPAPFGGLYPGFGPNRDDPLRGLSETTGIAVYNNGSVNQLIVADRFDNSSEGRFKIWNDYINKPPVNFAADFSIRDNRSTGKLPSFGFFSSAVVKVNNADTFWVLTDGGVRVYNLPFQAIADSTITTQTVNAPIKDGLKIYWPSSAGGDECVGCAVSIAYDKVSNKVFIVDDTHNRILRIADASAPDNRLTIDMVIGQPDKQTVKCNHNQELGWLAPGPSVTDGLCHPVAAKFDGEGNLFVTENTAECHGNARISMWKKTSIDSGNGNLFPAIKAYKAFNGSNTASNNGLIVTTPSCGTSSVSPQSLVGIAFMNKSRGVVLENEDHWSGDPAIVPTTILWYYDNYDSPTVSPRARIVLPLGAPADIAIDQNDNIVVRDGTWTRAWVINPFDIDQNNPSQCAWMTNPTTGAKFAASNGVCSLNSTVSLPTNTPTPSPVYNPPPPPTATPTVTPSPTIAYNPPPPANTPTPTVTPTPTQPVNTVDTTPPTLTITSPKNNAVIGKYTIAQLAATASDSSGVKLMTIAVDGKLLKSCPNNPINCIVYYGFTPGSHIVTVTASDYASPVSNTTAKSVTVVKSK